MADEVVRYLIDADDFIVAVGGAWRAFAFDNGAPELADGVIGRPIWDFVADAATREIYRRLLGRVRTGHPISFDYRCDAPACRRFMRMTLGGGSGRTIEFVSRTLRTERRAPVSIPLRPEATAPTLPAMCSWCNRVRVGDAWNEIEVAVEHLRLLAGLPPSGITHTMCPACAEVFLAETPGE